MYVCVFITRFPFKGVLQVNGVRARAPKWLQFWDLSRARGPLSHRGPFPMEIVFYVSICKHTHIYIYTHIYIHTHIYIYVCEWICPIPSHQNLGYPVMGPGLEGTSWWDYGWRTQEGLVYPSHVLNILFILFLTKQRVERTNHQISTI